MQACAAQQLNVEDRKNIAIEVVSQKKTITQAANDYDTSRKFIEQQRDKALAGIENNFKEQESDVLFYLPINKAWIHQLVLALAMFCKASYRNIIAILDYLFDYKMAIGTVFNIINQASVNAEKINNAQDLSNIKEAAIDEMFLNNSPILTGVDLYSTYCFLLKDEDDREGETWEKHLVVLKDQGLNPDKFIADFGSGLRLGLNLSYEDTPCHGDVFHVLFDLKKLSLYFRNRVKSRKTLVDKLLAKLGKATKKEKNIELEKQLEIAEKDKEKFMFLSCNISILVDWMAHDVLSIAGGSPESRSMLYDYIISELKLLEELHPHKIKATRTTLENRKDNILAFTLDMDKEFENIAEQFKGSKEDLWYLCELHRCERFSAKYYNRSEEIKKKLGMKDYIILMGLVGQVINTTTRASSLVENLNGRIRPFCNLRKQMGDRFTELLKFFLNHNQLTCSRKKERKNKTPAAILNKQEHAPWLEMLGFKHVEPIALI